MTSFADLINNTLEKGDSTISLNPFEHEFIKKIVDTQPDKFNEIIKIDNENITIKDIPNLVLIISKLFIGQITDGDIDINIVNLIEFTITVLLNTLPMPEFERQLLSQVLDYSIELLKTNLPYIETKIEEISVGCFNWTKNTVSRMYNNIKTYFTRK